MAQAMERLPVVEAELNEARYQLKANHDYVQTLQTRLVDRATEIDTLKAKVLTAEASRDDAELRFLEAEDIAGTLKNVLRRAMDDADSALKAVEPPVAVTEALTEPTTTTIIPEWERVSQGYAIGPFATPTAEGSSSDASDAEGTKPTAEGSVATEGSVPLDPTAPELTLTTEPPSASSFGVETATSVQSTLVDDPEPNDRWTRAWYAWNDRQVEAKADKAMAELSPLPAASRASHNS